MGTGVSAQWTSPVAVDAQSDRVLGWDMAVHVSRLSKAAARELGVRLVLTSHAWLPGCHA